MASRSAPQPADDKWPPPAPAGEQPDVPGAPLFRPQVLAERQSQWLGTVMLKPRA